jgi:RecA-family ATPase
VDIETSGPYGRAWDAYRRAGWSGVLALPPARKGPPPAGFTGWAGVDPSRADIQAWLDDPRLGEAANIGLHLPSGVYGLDVDNYGGKTGGAALAALVERLGPLPSTWVVSSRDDGVSGIRLYRATLPPGRVWIDEPGGHGVGIEAIHKGHRYAVVWPSVHPDTGRVYTWRNEAVAGVWIIPTAGELPELPAVWVEALSRSGEVRAGTQAGHDETVATVTSWREGEPCERVTRAAERAMGGLAAAAAGAALHPASEAGTWELACLGHEGHAGVRRALAEHYAGHIAARVARDGEVSRREADGEWWRLVRGAIGKLVGPPRERCDCDAWSGVGLTFTPEDLGVYAPAPAASLEQNLPTDSGILEPARELTSWTLSPAELMARPRPEPIVSGLLYRDTLAWLIGKSGSFKSFVALDLAAAVADEGGRKWLGRAVYGGPVLYVVAEGVGGMGLRIQAWTERNGPMSERLRLLPRAVQAKSDGWPILVELARQLAPALIVVDTQARVSVGVNENSNTEIGELIARLDELRAATRACVLVVHHIGRSGEDARGASALDGAQDTELKVERVGGPKALQVKLTVDKQKDAPDTDAITLNLEAVELGHDPTTGEALSSLVVLPDLVLDPFPVAPWRMVKNENQALILQILGEQFSEHGGTRAEVAGVLRELGQRGEAKYRRATFYDAWNAILKKDLIERIPGTQRFILSDAAMANTLTCVGPDEAS